MELTYSSYLKLEHLLQLQKPISSPSVHDEMLFIIIHQSSELWFKLLLYELEKIKKDFSSDNLYGAITTFQRVKVVMRFLINQLDIIETMTPTSFAQFRDRLKTASGFQSYQFRQFEFMLGYKRSEVLSFYKDNPTVYEKLAKAFDQNSLIDYFHDFLQHQGIAILGQIPKQAVSSPPEPSEVLQQEILRLYHQRPDLVILFELMIDFDESLQDWRYRHIKVVERIIGNKQGTGGSLGVNFLKKSLFQAVFPDLWAIRDKI